MLEKLGGNYTFYGWGSWGSDIDIQLPFDWAKARARIIWLPVMAVPYTTQSNSISEGNVSAGWKWRTGGTKLKTGFAVWFPQLLQVAPHPSFPSNSAIWDSLPQVLKAGLLCVAWDFRGRKGDAKGVALRRLLLPVNIKDISCLHCAF